MLHIYSKSAASKRNMITIFPFQIFGADSKEPYKYKRSFTKKEKNLLIESLNTKKKKLITMKSFHL